MIRRLHHHHPHPAHHHPRCSQVPDARVHVHLLPGERRAVVQRMVNDAEESITFSASVGPVVDLASRETVPASPITVQPAGLITLAPGQGAEVSYWVEATGLSARRIYRAEIRFGETFFPPLVLALFVEHSTPIVARHDPSRIRAWLKGHCFEREPVRWCSGGAFARSDCEFGCCGAPSHTHHKPC